MMLIAVAAAMFIGLVTIGSQSAIAVVVYTGLEEDVESGNATTMMMTNQTADGNTTGTNSTS